MGWVGSVVCGLLRKRDLDNSAKGTAYQLARATHCFASAETFPSDVGGTECVANVRQH